MEKVDAAVQFAYRAAETKYEDFTEKEVFVTKRSILDTVGVLLASTTLGTNSQKVVEMIQECGGKAESTILGYGGKYPAMLAAFANGAVVHALDYDDVYDFAGGSHPSAATLPATLAIAERKGGVSGKELITAITVGNDMICRIGLSCPKAFPVYVHAPMAMGTFGASLACGKILDLDKEQMVSCLGFALSQMAGSPQSSFCEGDTDVRELYQAMPAKAAVVSALLAQKGLRGGRESLEGVSGYYNHFVRGVPYNRDWVNVKRGDNFEGSNVSIKPYAACRGTHRYIDGARTLMQRHGIKAEDIEQIIVKIGTDAKNLCIPDKIRREPDQPSDARYSIIYTTAACVAYGGNINLASFLPENLKNPKVKEMVDKTVWEIDPEIDRLWNTNLEPSIVVLKCKDGGTYTERVTDCRGTRGNPMSIEEVIEKFRDCAKYAIKPLSTDRVDKIIDMCMNLEDVSNINELISLIS